MRKGDFIGAREIGQVLGHGIVQRQLAFLRQQQNCRRGELLADRADGVPHAGLRVHRWREPRLTIGVEIGDAAVHYDRDRGAGNSARHKNLIAGCIDLLRQRRRESVLWLNRGGRRSGKSKGTKRAQDCHKGSEQKLRTAVKERVEERWDRHTSPNSRSSVLDRPRLSICYTILSVGLEILEDS